MPLASFLESHPLPQPDFPLFAHGNLKMPLPQFDRLAIEALVGDIRKALLRTPTNGDLSLVLRYKDTEAALLSVDYRDTDGQFSIGQVQGARSRVSYRVATTLDIPGLLAHQLLQLAEHPGLSVRSITMPPEYLLPGVLEGSSQYVSERYGAVRKHLGMRFSEDLGVYVRDIVR